MSTDTKALRELKARANSENSIMGALPLYREYRSLLEDSADALLDAADRLAALEAEDAYHYVRVPKSRLGEVERAYIAKFQPRLNRTLKRAA